MYDTMKTVNLYDLSQTIASELLGETIYPWEALPKIGEFIRVLASYQRRSTYSRGRISGSRRMQMLLPQRRFMDRRLLARVLRSVTALLFAATLLWVRVLWWEILLSLRM